MRLAGTSVLLLCAAPLQGRSCNATNVRMFPVVGGGCAETATSFEEVVGAPHLDAVETSSSGPTLSDLHGSRAASAYTVRGQGWLGFRVNSAGGPGSCAGPAADPYAARVVGRSTVRMVGLAALVILLGGCSTAAPTPDPYKGRYVVSGAATPVEVMQALAAAFHAHHPGMEWTFDDTGSAAAIGLVTGGIADVGMTRVPPHHWRSMSIRCRTRARRHDGSVFARSSILDAGRHAASHMSV